YNRAFSTLAEVQHPTVASNRETSWHLYVLRLNLERLSAGRDEFLNALVERGVGCSVHFIPLHLHPYYRDAFDYRPDDFPVALAEYQRAISLPIYSSMSDDDIEWVIEQVKATAFQF